MLADDSKRPFAILLEAPNVCQTEAVDVRSVSLIPWSCVNMRTPLIGYKGPMLLLLITISFM